MRFVHLETWLSSDFHPVQREIFKTVLCSVQYTVLHSCTLHLGYCVHGIYRVTEGNDRIQDAAFALSSLPVLSRLLPEVGV